MLKKSVFLILSLIILLSSSTLIPQKEIAHAATTTYSLGSAYESGGYQPDAGSPSFGNWSNNIPFSGTNTNLVKWTVSSTKLFLATPTVDKDGTSYYMDQAKGLVALNPDGSTKWERPFTTATNHSSVAIGKDGTLYYAGDSAIYALNPDNTEKWNYTVNTVTNFTSTPAIGGDGTIYAYDNKSLALYALNPDKSLKWKKALTDNMDNQITPQIGSDGTIYILTQSKFYALNPTDGSVKWEIINGTILAGADRTFTLLPDHKIAVSSYVGNAKGKVYIMDATAGNVTNTITTDNINGGRFAVYSEYSKTLIVSDYKNVVSYNLDGTKNWSYATNGTVNVVPLIDANGIIYIGSNEGILTALKPDGTVKWALNFNNYFGSTTAYFSMSPMSFGVSRNGTLFMTMQYYKNATTNYAFVAVGDDSTPIPDPCTVGYLEDLETKIQAGNVTNAEIQEARYRLIKDLYNLNQLEQEKTIAQ